MKTIEERTQSVRCEVCNQEPADRLVRFQRTASDQAWQFRCHDCADKLTDEIGFIVIDTNPVELLGFTDLVRYVEGSGL
jgi:hypothetical protein